MAEEAKTVFTNRNPEQKLSLFCDQSNNNNSIVSPTTIHPKMTNDCAMSALSVSMTRASGPFTPQTLFRSIGGKDQDEGEEELILVGALESFSQKQDHEIKRSALQRVYSLG